MTDTLDILCANLHIEAEYQGRVDNEERLTFGEHDEWIVALTYQGRKYRDITYRMGTGLSPEWFVSDKSKSNYGLHSRNWKATPPTATELIDSLFVDVNHLEEGFEGWAGDFGFDTDSRKAYAIYQQCLETLPRLRALLGADFAKFEEAAWDY